MTNEPGWTENPTVLLQQQIMMLMADGEKESRSIAQRLDVELDPVGQQFESMADSGFVTTGPLRLADRYPSVAILTADGRDEVAAWASRRSGGRAQRECEAALLSWLDAHEGERILSTGDFKDDVRAHLYGEPFTDDTITRAARSLHEHGLIKGSPTFGGVVLRPTITPTGRGVVSQHNGDLAAWLASSGSQ